MYVKGLFGGFYASNENQYDLTEFPINYGAINGNQTIIFDGRELTYDEKTLMIGDVLLVYDTNYANESYAYGSNNMYLYLGNGEFATSNGSKVVIINTKYFVFNYIEHEIYENDGIVYIDGVAIDNNNPVVFPYGNDNYIFSSFKNDIVTLTLQSDSSKKATRTAYNRILNSLMGQNAFIILRPSYAMTNPTAAISSTTSPSANSQTATLACTDATKYYWGTNSEPAAGDFTNYSAAVEKTVNEAGTYYLVCKDNSDNSSITSITYNNYKINQMLETTTGTSGTYTTDNYSLVKESIYIISDNATTSLNISNEIPTGSSIARYKGISQGEPSTSAATVTQNIEEINSSEAYTLWFDRNKVIIRYNTNGGETKGTYTSDSEGNILNASSSRNIQSIKYESALGTGGLYNHNSPNYIDVAKEGYKVKNNEVWCTNPDGSGNCYDESTQYSADEFCDASASDCTVTLYVNWVEDIPGEFLVNFGNLNVDDNAKVIKRILYETTVSDILSVITTNGTKKIVSSNDQEMNDDEIIKNGDKLVITYNDTDVIYTLQVLGDVNSDGNVDRLDAIELALYIINKSSNIDTQHLLLGDMNNDGIIKMNDVMLLIRQIKEFSSGN